jgi:transmembrane sensor
MTATLPDHILEEAADYLVRWQAGQVSDDDRAAHARWLARSADHARAWARAERLMQNLGALPPQIALPVLGRKADPCRRAAIAKLASLLALAPAGWLVTQTQGWQCRTADYQTVTGETRRVQLADGSRVVLGTASAIDVMFTPTDRTVRLIAGDILIDTAADPAALQRPFQVLTAQGAMQALGTRFTVRQDTGRTRLAVLDGAVRITPRQGGPGAQMVLSAGRQTRFSDHAVGAISVADDSIAAWTQGMLLADDQGLSDVLDELARYRSGVVSCDPAIAHLRVSGAFPITDTDRALAMLADTYPVSVHRRLGGYWVTLAARPPQ